MGSPITSEIYQNFSISFQQWQYSDLEQACFAAAAGVVFGSVGKME